MRSRTHHANGSQHSHGAPQSGTGSTEPGHAAPITGADNVAFAGTTGDDRIVAGANDTMTGGGGTDEFILGITSGKSEITDFAVAGGIIDVKPMGLPATTFDALKAHITDVNGNAVVDFGNGDTLQLDGVTSASLTAANFELPGSGGGHGQGGGHSHGGGHGHGGGHDHGGPGQSEGSHHAAAIHGTDNSAVAGTTGNDKIVAGANDTMTGGGGNDEFIFGASSGKSEITDFGTTGIIDLKPAGLSYTDFATLMTHVTETNGNAVIDLGAGNSITLDKVDMTALTTANFELAGQGGHGGHGGHGHDMLM